MLRQLVEQTQSFSAAIERLKVQEWISAGASSTYARQQDVVKTQAGYLRTVAVKLAEDPEKLSLALDAYFRLQSMETFAISLAEAAGRYQDSQAAQQVQELVSRNSATATKLRQYVMDLSVTKEQEYTIVEKEAHRCQAMLNQPPPVGRPATKGKK
ncbi:MAG: hypothetical protein HY820_31525 [Acidobacteria bacterium]|nr:hypothetical protein [Acidobacteriota bacterium]